MKKKLTLALTILLMVGFITGMVIDLEKTLLGIMLVTIILAGGGVLYAILDTIIGED
jgi:hypothetical protein